jgi:uncharacterized protein YwqG
MIWGLFGSKKRETKAPEPQMRDVRALTPGLAIPAIHIVKTLSQTSSFIGGTPALPSDVTWPAKDGRKLGFIAQIDLAAVHATEPVDWLPPAGTLLFFYEVSGSSWGFDPKHRGGWAVVHSPEIPAAQVAAPALSDAKTPLVGTHVAFRRIESYPSWERDVVAALNLTEEESEVYNALGDASFGNEPQHQLGGFPSPIQGDLMELKCQLASNGVYCGDGKYLKDPRTTELKRGAKDWRLLLQVDTDDAINAMWGDAGRLYFFVREQDARAVNFSNVWMVLQCC